MASTPEPRAIEPVVYEYGGSLFRVNGHVECLIGGEWLPSQLTLDALKEAGARALEDEELERLRAQLPVT